MWANYLKIALRNLTKHKTYSLINILGLAIGMAAALLILLFIRSELSYDRYHEHADRIYRVVRDFHDRSGDVSLRLAHVAPAFPMMIPEEVPEVEVLARTWEGGQWLIDTGGKQGVERSVSFADPELFDILTIPMVKGDGPTALSEPFSLILSETMARKYFGEENPLGKQVKVDDEFLVKVGGVMADFPENTYWHTDILFSFKSLEAYFGPEEFNDQNFGSNNYTTLVRLPAETDPKIVEAKFDDMLDRRMNTFEHSDGSIGHASEWTHLYLQPIPWIHLNSDREDEIEANGDIRYVYLMGLIALMILAIACINFMNLATARSADRAREVGLRKVIGANRRLLILQFLGESMVITVVAMLLAIFLVQLSLPLFSQFIGRTLQLNPFSSPIDFGALAVFLLLVGLASGTYPAFYLSAFQPVRILRGEITRGRGGARLRKSLVVFQFAVSVGLILCVGVVQKQLSYMQAAKLGFDKENVVGFGANGAIRGDWNRFKQRLLANPGIVSVTAGSRLPGGRLLDSGGGSIELDGEMASFPVRLPDVRVDHDYFSTLGMELVAGRGFRVDHPTDSTEAFVINEEAATKLGFSSPEQAVGTPMTYRDHDGRVIGVVRDFHFESFRNSITPIVFYIAPESYRNVIIRLAASAIPETIDEIKQVYSEYETRFPPRISFLDERLDRQYTAERRLMTIFAFFASLAVFVGCLGLVGLASFTAERRTKEIGIRKTLGASVRNIVGLLTGEFVLLVLIGTAIAWPIAGWLMNRWLEGFAYRTELGISLFLLSGAAALVVALISVVTQALRAANTDPAKALRTE
ncbi:ABC transporter permease [bacterium]|nr:ABC transporter permease [bacterium]